MNKDKEQVLKTTEENIKILNHIIRLEKEILEIGKVDVMFFDNAKSSGVDKFE